MGSIRTAEHVHEEQLVNYVRGGLAGKNASELESHLSTCEVCQEALSTCVGLQFHLHYTGRRLEGQMRAEPRFETKDEAILQELHPLSFERQKVKVLNVSRNGLGILAANPVFPGAIVQIRIGKSVELGEVRHCKNRGLDGFRVGLRLYLPS